MTSLAEPTSPADHDWHEARRQDLLEATVRAIRRNGPSASMEKIAAEAGITKPILYRYFGGRAGLYEAIAEQANLAIVKRLRRSFQDAPSPRQLLVRGIAVYLELVESDPQLYRFLMEAPRSGDSVQRFVRRVGTQVGDLLKEMLAGSGVDPRAAEVWGHGIVGMVHTAGDWWLQEALMPREVLLDRLTDLLWLGLRHVVPAPGEALSASADSHLELR